MKEKITLELSKSDGTAESKDFEVHELLAPEFDEIQKIENNTDSTVALIKKSSDMSDEDYSRLLLRERTKLMDVINKLNGWLPSNSETEKKQ